MFLEEGRWKPFPTLLWLVCPRLRPAISRLEQDRLAQGFARRLVEDEAFRQQFDEGQRVMIAYRLRLAKEVCGEEPPPAIVRVLSETTIAGSHFHGGVKCLHAHVAQELAWGNNPIGAETLRLVGRCSATKPCLTSHEPGEKA